MSSLRVRLVALLASAVLLGACSAVSQDASTSPEGDGTGTPAGEEPTTPPVRVSANVKQGRPVRVDKVIRVSVDDGTLRSVTLRSTSGGKAVQVRGHRTGQDKWISTGRLEPGRAYAASVVALDADGALDKSLVRFRTDDLTLDEQTYPSVAPVAGETVGVGMPVIVNFDIPVQRRALFEQHMSVHSTPAHRGSWHWVSANEAHWRPRHYWQAGTQVRVDVDVNSLPAGGGVYGQESRRVRFRIGDAVISRVDAAAHQMQTFVNGQLVKTTPITTGKPGFTTRSGIKVIMEKHLSKRMSSETIGIGEGSSEFYDIDNVQYAMRLTYSGEFLHAAPWSVGSQGYANVSHGCTGMSTSDAAWLYSISKRGDVVEYVGTDRWMDLYNGYGDWNASFEDYARGSALT